jgi:hypothetical protein
MTPASKHTALEAITQSLRDVTSIRGTEGQEFNLDTARFEAPTRPSKSTASSFETVGCGTGRRKKPRLTARQGAIRRKFASPASHHVGRWKAVVIMAKRRFTIPIAHAIPDAVEAAYRCGDLFDKRRKLMDAWAAYCAKIETDAGKVVALARARTPR